jgi:hypothetical protein
VDIQAGKMEGKAASTTMHMDSTFTKHISRVEEATTSTRIEIAELRGHMKFMNPLMVFSGLGVSTLLLLALDLLWLL